jgi:uncharacterized Fe-S cluster protein YjdI
MQGKKYSGDGIDVYFDARRCIHAARCIDGLPEVFDKNRRPWIDPHKASPEALAALVLQCPSGALHTTMPEAPDAVDSIAVTANGPLYVRGDIKLQLQDGTIVNHDTRLALCRCGDSKNKPFCDNSHIAKGFTG